MAILVNKISWKFSGVFLLIILIIGTKMFLKQEKEKVLEWQFKGAVQTVKYNAQARPIFTISGKEYNAFHLIWNVGVKIYIGDTLIKNKGDLRLMLLRRDSKDTIYFNR